MFFSTFSFFILTMYLPGMGEPARGTMVGAGKARAAGKSARRTRNIIMAGGEAKIVDEAMTMG